MKKHTFWMIITCVLPMVLLAVVFAFRGEYSSFAWLMPVFCIGSHLFMMRGHGRHEPHMESLPYHHDNQKGE